jgi:hypothetical protein
VEAPPREKLERGAKVQVRAKADAGKPDEKAAAHGKVDAGKGAIAEDGKAAADTLAVSAAKAAGPTTGAAASVEDSRVRRR